MNVRKYGNFPYQVAVIHGGPGAVGGAKTICEELSSTYNVLEPLQTKKTVEGQLLELKEILEEHTDEPITLIGHSWGAMLVYMFASKYPALVKKVILVSTGGLEEKYSVVLKERREEKLKKLSESELKELNDIQTRFSNPKAQDMNRLFAKYGAIMEKIDSFEPIESDVDDHLYNFEIFRSIWEDAIVLRNKGEIHKMGKDIKCDVVAIHGDYDSHPAYGVKDSLSKVLKDYKFIILDKCGHTPWLEKFAKEKFYKILLDEIR